MLSPDKKGATMTRHPYDMKHMLQARPGFVREARALPPGAERNQKRQIARSLKRLIESQIRAWNSSAVSASRH